MQTDHSSTQQTVAGGDGRGNVTVLLDALATDPNTPANNLKAGVEYAPYGEMVRSTGDLGQMPFRFQSKWALGQGWTGGWPVELLDFGRRVYAPGGIFHLPANHQLGIHLDVGFFGGWGTARADDSPESLAMGSGIALFGVQALA